MALLSYAYHLLQVEHGVHPPGNAVCREVRRYAVVALTNLTFGNTGIKSYLCQVGKTIITSFQQKTFALYRLSFRRIFFFHVHLDCSPFHAFSLTFLKLISCFLRKICFNSSSKLHIGISHTVFQYGVTWQESCSSSSPTFWNPYWELLCACVQFPGLVDILVGQLDSPWDNLRKATAHLFRHNKYNHIVIIKYIRRTALECCGSKYIKGYVNQFWKKNLKIIFERTTVFS